MKGSSCLPCLGADTSTQRSPHHCCPVLPWGCPPHPQPPALLHAPSPSTPPHPALHRQPSHYPSLRSVPSQNVPALSSPHPPHPSFCSCCCIPPQRCILTSPPLAEGWENAQEHMLALQKSLPPPQSGCLIKQAAGLGPAPGGSGSSTAAESPAERAERCREYQSVRLGHSQRFHRAGDPPEPAGTQQGSASLGVWGGESNRGDRCLGGAGGRGREQGREKEGVGINVRAGGWG